MKLSKATAGLAALAQQDRLAIYRLLVKAGPDGMTPGSVAQTLKLPAPTLSFHLAKLAAAGLVWSRRAGRHVIYAPDLVVMNALVAFLTAECCSGNPDLCRPASRRASRKEAANA